MTETLRIAVRKYDPFVSAIKKQFSDFVAVNNLDLRLETEIMDLNPLHDTLFAKGRLQNGDFDIAFIPTDWIAEAQSLGLIEDLTPIMRRSPLSGFPEAWSKSLLGLQSIGGGFWGMPYHDGPQCLIYRKDLLEQAGLPVPTTWEEFHATARKLQDPASGRYGTLLALYPDGHNAFYDFCIHLWTRGGEAFDNAGKPQFLSDAAHDALEFIRTLAGDETAVAPNLREIESIKSGILFNEGKLALMTNWFGFAIFGETASDSKVAGKIDVAPLPSGKNGQSVSLNVFWLLTIAAGSTKKALAWDFIRHCASAPMDKLLTLEGAIGVRRSTWSDADVNRIAPYYEKLDELHTRARELPVHPRLSEIAHVVDDLMTKATTTDRPSSELLREAQAEIERIVA